MPTSLQGAEEAIKKHEDFLTTTEASEEKITGVVEAGRRLINDCNANSDKIQEKVDSIQERLGLSKWMIVGKTHLMQVSHFNLMFEEMLI